MREKIKDLEKRSRNPNMQGTKVPDGDKVRVGKEGIIKTHARRTFPCTEERLE